MNIKYSKAEDILLLEISDGKIDYTEEDGPIIKLNTLGKGGLVFKGTGKI